MTLNFRMKWPHLLRLWQPSRALFWLMLVFNVFSSLGSYVMRAWPLNTAGLMLVGGLSLANVAGGLWAAWQLITSPQSDATGHVSGSAQNEPP
jgi:small neutral amino acid transporter SnatA (MarC family)